MYSDYNCRLLDRRCRLRTRVRWHRRHRHRRHRTSIMYSDCNRRLLDANTSILVRYLGNRRLHDANTSILVWLIATLRCTLQSENTIWLKIRTFEVSYCFFFLIISYFFTNFHFLLSLLLLLVVVVVYEWKRFFLHVIMFLSTVLDWLYLVNFSFF